MTGKEGIGLDIALQMRGIELLIKLMKHDMSGVPPYGYRRQKLDVPGAPQSAPLPRCTPEQAGISSAVVQKLFRSLSEQTDILGVHGVMLLRHGKVFAEGYWAPYRADLPHMLYSMSKSITSTAVGFAVEEGLLSLDEKLGDIFTDLPAAQNKAMRQVTVWNLLTMSTGSRLNELGSMLDGDWVRVFLESNPKFEPGTTFEYNSMNSYMLAAIVCRRAGMPLVDYLKPRLFDPLGITRYTWETCPKNIEKGGWGLSLTLEDAAKIGQLYLQRGNWEGKQLLSEAWIQEATRAQIETPNGESKNGYGYQMWISPHGYQFNGVFGQYVVVLPEYDAVAAIFSGSIQLFAQTDLMQLLTACFWGGADAPLPEYAQGQQSLTKYLSSLVLSPRLNWEGLGNDPEAFDTIANMLHGHEYRLENTAGSIFPQPIQNVHTCYSSGADILRFTKADKGLALTVYEHCERNTLYIDKDGGLHDTRVALREEEHLVSTRALWQLGEGGAIRMALLTSFVETPDTCILYIMVEGDTVSLTFDEAPSVEAAAELMMQLVGLNDKAAIKRLAPAMKHVPGFNENTINDLILSYAVPRVTGQRIRFRDVRPGEAPLIENQI
jgi:CubicO group peptidase (beta-lactamase class C family)